MRDAEERIREAGAAVAAVGLGDRHHGAAFKEETGISFPLLVDEEREAYKAVGLKQGTFLQLLRGEAFAARRRARDAGHRQHRLGKNPFQLGGSFVFGPGNVDRYAHVSGSYGDNAPLDELLAALRG